jgi:hypothetical protein
MDLNVRICEEHAVIPSNFPMRERSDQLSEIMEAPGKHSRGGKSRRKDRQEVREEEREGAKF